jgi:hypothetical protein
MSKSDKIRAEQEAFAESKGAKSKAPKADKADKAEKKGGFAKPSEAKGGGDGWNLTEEAVDRLLIVTPLREDEVATEEWGTKPIIVANVVVVNEKKPEKSEEHLDVYIFGGYLRGSLRDYVGKQMVAARLVQGETKVKGNYPWLFEDANDAEEALCQAYLDSVKPFGKSKK